MKCWVVRMRRVKANARRIALQVVELDKSASAMADTVNPPEPTSKVMLYFSGFELPEAWSTIGCWSMFAAKHEAARLTSAMILRQTGDIVGLLRLALWMSF